jgi:hypothetical protein
LTFDVTTSGASGDAREPNDAICDGATFEQ